MTEKPAKGMITITLPCGHKKGIDCVRYCATVTISAQSINADGEFCWDAPEIGDYMEAEYCCAECGAILIADANDADDLRDWLYENTNLDPPKDD